MCLVIMYRCHTVPCNSVTYLPYCAVILYLAIMNRCHTATRRTVRSIYHHTIQLTYYSTIILFYHHTILPSYYFTYTNLLTYFSERRHVLTVLIHIHCHDDKPFPSYPLPYLLRYARFICVLLRCVLPYQPESAPSRHRPTPL